MWCGAIDSKPTDLDDAGNRAAGGNSIHTVVGGRCRPQNDPAARHGNYCCYVNWVDFLKRRMAEKGYDYPIWIPAFCNIALVVALLASVAQRWPGTTATWIALVVMLFPEVYFVLVGWIPRWIFGLLYCAGTSLLLLDPAHPDIAPMTLIIVVAIAAASSALVESVAVWIGAMVVIGVPTLTGSLDSGWIYLLGIEFGWSAGFMLLSQNRQLSQEREAQSARSLEAAADERRRIAREVHDVVAHSLSVTMLHLTGARRALEVDRDIDDAVESLRDAERMGRQAMADIRKTVGLLDKSSAISKPEPGIEDVGSLLADFEKAGFPVQYEISGDRTSVSAATGMGVYRIMQESMTNVAKHAPGASIDAQVRVSKAGTALLVRNTLPHGAHFAPDRDGGTGLSGMRTRTESLGGEFEAGPDRDGWAVKAIFPVDRADSDSLCLLKRWLQR